MSEEIELAAKALGEVVAALTEQSGAVAVPAEYAHYVASRIHLRHYPALVERAMAAAKKIKESGLPRRAFSAIDEPLLSAILEGMAEETNPDLQEAWENLLANTVTDGNASTKRRYPEILRQLDPEDAATLDRFSTHLQPGALNVITIGPGAAEPGVLDNLTSLGLLRYTRSVPTTLDEIDDANARINGVAFTEQGWAFLRSCRAPRAFD